MVLTVAEAMADFSTRNTMVFCLWSGEEGGKRGSDFWTDYWVKPKIIQTSKLPIMSTSTWLE